MPVEVYIALGSNLECPPLQITRAIRALAKLPSTRIVKQAPWYRSLAIGPGPQANYINTVVAITTTLTPLRLLKALQSIEQQQKRKHRVRWGPRTIDLDILLYGRKTLNREARNRNALIIPHPRLQQRNFVLYPLADIAPHLVLPDQTPLQQLLANCCPEGIVRLEAGETRGCTG